MSLKESAHDIKQLFEEYDKDNSGFLTREELSKIIERFGVTDQVEINDLTRSDSDLDGEFSLIELAEILGFKEDVDKYRQLFYTVDTDESGFLELHEIVRVLEMNGVKNPQIEAERMLNLGGKTTYDSLSCEEFLCIMIFEEPLRKREKFVQVEPLSQESIEALRTIFSKYDKNGSGNISKKELKMILTDELKREVSKEEMRSVMKKGDLNKDGKISMSEFLVMMGLSSEINTYWNLFKEFDADGSGRLERREIAEIMKKLNVKHPKRETKAILKTFGPKKKSLSFDNFVNVMIRF